MLGLIWNRMKASVGGTVTVMVPITQVLSGEVADTVMTETVLK